MGDTYVRLKYRTEEGAEKAVWAFRVGFFGGFIRAKRNGDLGSDLPHLPPERIISVRRAVVDKKTWRLRLQRHADDFGLPLATTIDGLDIE